MTGTDCDRGERCCCSLRLRRRRSSKRFFICSGPLISVRGSFSLLFSLDAFVGKVSVVVVDVEDCFFVSSFSGDVAFVIGPVNKLHDDSVVPDEGENASFDAVVVSPLLSICSFLWLDWFSCILIFLEVCAFLF